MALERARTRVAALRAAPGGLPPALLCLCLLAAALVAPRAGAIPVGAAETTTLSGRTAISDPLLVPRASDIPETEFPEFDLLQGTDLLLRRPTASTLPRLIDLGRSDSGAPAAPDCQDTPLEGLRQEDGCAPRQGGSLPGLPAN